MRLELYRQIFRRLSYIKFNKNPSVGASCSMRTDRRTERHDEANSHFFAILQTRLNIEEMVSKVYSDRLLSVCLIRMKTVS